MKLNNITREIDFDKAARIRYQNGLHQVLAATWYEMILQARRGGTWITMMVVQAVVVGFTLYLSWLTVSTNLAYYTSPQDVSFQVTTRIAETLSLAPLLLMAILPFTLADTIPAERRSNVIEVLKYLMVSPGVYLAGKVLGALGVLAVALLATTVFQSVATAIILGGIDVLFLIRMLGVLWIPLLIYATSISILLPSRFVSRRWAWAVAILFSLIGAISAFPVAIESNPLILGLLFPARSPALWFLQTCSYSDLRQGCPLPLLVVLASILPAVAQGLFAWVLARRWLMRGNE